MKPPTYPTATAWLAFIAAFLLNGCAPKSEPTSAQPPPAAAKPAASAGPALSAAQSKTVYERVCAVCHQNNGQGVAAVFPPLAGSPIVDGDPSVLIRIVLHGLQGPIEVKGTTYNGVMPGHADQLKDAQIAGVLTYIRSSWGHAAGPVAPADVAAIRASEKRSTPWTWAELNPAKP